MDKVEEIVQQLIRYKNGVVSDSMAENGLNYDVNYGVSVVNIKQIAKQYLLDNYLAMQLFAQPEREAKLAAVYIAEAATLSIEQIKIVLAQIVNSEMAEQISMNLLPNIPNAMQYATDCCKTTDTYLQKAGWMTIGRIAKQITALEMEDCLSLIDGADFSSVHIHSALVFALPKMAVTSGNAAKYITNWISKNKTSNNPDKQMFANEVASFLM